MTQHNCPTCQQRVKPDGSGLEAEMREYTEAERDAKQDVLSSLRVEYHNYTVEQIKLRQFYDDKIQKLEAEVAVLREALEMWKYPRNYPLRAFTDEEMNERIERTQKALTQTRAPLLLEVVRAAEDLTDYSKVITKNKFDVLKAAVDAYRESK